MFVTMVMKFQPSSQFLLLVQCFSVSALSTEWAGKLQSLLDTHGPIPKLQPLAGPVKPSDNDPVNFGMINPPVSY